MLSNALAILSLLYLFQWGASEEYDLQQFLAKGVSTLQLNASGINSTGGIYVKELPPDVNNVTLTLRAPPNIGISISIEYLRFSRYCQVFMELVSSSTRVRFCKSMTFNQFDSDSVVFRDSAINLLLHREFHDFSPSLKLRFTALQINNCDLDSFKCNNGYCVWKTSQCDGYNNCGDFSDEIDQKTGEPCGPLYIIEWDFRSTVVLVCVILIPAAMVVVCVLIACIVHLKKKERRPALSKNRTV